MISLVSISNSEIAQKITIVFLTQLLIPFTAATPFAVIDRRVTTRLKNPIATI